MIDHATAPNQSVIDHRRKQVRLATARHRRRRKHGLFLRTITVTKGDLHQLEKLGYLDPDRRGDRTEECDAIEMFLGDSLRKGQPDLARSSAAAAPRSVPSSTAMPSNASSDRYCEPPSLGRKLDPRTRGRGVA